MQVGTSHIALSVVCFIAGCIIGAGLRSCSSPKQSVAEPIVIRDTITITDTLRIKEHTKPKEVVLWDTLVVRDTDTIRVEIPIERKEYRDTFLTDTSRIELGVRYQGYKAKIDGIDLQYHFDVKPRTIEKKKGWGQFIGVGIGVGYGASVIDHRVYAAPEVGVHITYGWGYTWRK